MHPHTNNNYLHHQKPGIASTIREVVFGLEDGMVSTMGAITGIAVGTGNHFTIILAGLVIISVESISMAVGSYISSKSEQDMEQRMIAEEKEEIEEFPAHEQEEMEGLFIADGWPRPLAQKMAAETAKNKTLMLREMAYRELGVVMKAGDSPLRNGLLMWASYIGGGIIPIVPYIVITPVQSAIPVSVGLTLVALFFLGVGTSRFSKRNWLKSGMEMLLLAGLAALVGYFVGGYVEQMLGM